MFAMDAVRQRKQQAPKTRSKNERATVPLLQTVVEYSTNVPDSKARTTAKQATGEGGYNERATSEKSRRHYKAKDATTNDDHDDGRRKRRTCCQSDGGAGSGGSNEKNVAETAEKPRR